MSPVETRKSKGYADTTRVYCLEAWGSNEAVIIKNFAIFKFNTGADAWVTKEVCF
jgi:hypothetical protein